MDSRWLASGGVHKGKQAGWFTTSDGRMATSDHFGIKARTLS